MVDLKALGERSITLDCDVLQADGGTRCASITGGYVALRHAVQGLLDKKTDPDDAADRLCRGGRCRIGLYQGEALLDLDYAEDSNAEVDVNVVMDGAGGLIEVQGTAEDRPFSS